MMHSTRSPTPAQFFSIDSQIFTNDFETPNVQVEKDFSMSTNTPLHILHPYHFSGETVSKEPFKGIRDSRSLSPLHSQPASSPLSQIEEPSSRSPSSSLDFSGSEKEVTHTPSGRSLPGRRTVKRPPNQFMLYRKTVEGRRQEFEKYFEHGIPPDGPVAYLLDKALEYHHNIVAKGREKDRSRQLGAKWKSMDIEGRKIFEALQAIIKQLHAVKHPGYVYVPHRRGKSRSQASTPRRRRPAPKMKRSRSIEDYISTSRRASLVAVLKVNTVAPAINVCPPTSELLESFTQSDISSNTITDQQDGYNQMLCSDQHSPRLVSLADYRFPSPIPVQQDYNDVAPIHTAWSFTYDQTPAFEYNVNTLYMNVGNYRHDYATSRPAETYPVAVPSTSYANDQISSVDLERYDSFSSLEQYWNDYTTEHGTALSVSNDKEPLFEQGTTIDPRILKVHAL